MPPKAAPRRGGAAAPRPAATEANDSASPAPNDRSTATPGPSGRPPVQRLQSLNRRTPAGSIAPARPSPLGTGGSGPGEPAKPTLKYKPRAVGRRSKEEREAIEKLEAERNRERLKEAAAIQRGRGGHRGDRGGFGRGRGGGVAAGGPMGAGGARRGRGGRFVEGDSRASSMSRRSRSVVDLGSGVASQDVSSDESDSGIRVSIDYITLDSDDEEFDEGVDKKKGKIPARNRRDKGLRPIRVERREHEERVVSVNMESSSRKTEEKREQAAEQAEDDALFVQQDAEPETETRVKEEPEDEDQIMTEVPRVDEAPTDDGFLPTQKVKVRRNLSPKAQQQQQQKEQAKPTTAVAPVQAPAVPPKDPRTIQRTKEEIEEFERHQQDLLEVKKLLAVEPEEKEKEKGSEEEKDKQNEKEKAKGKEPVTQAPPEAPETATEESQDRSDSKEEEEETPEDKLAGELFLVQFPPMTPNLIVPGSNTENENTEPAEPRQSREGGGEAPVKHEEDAEVLDDADNTRNETPKVVTATDWQLSAGRVGKLNVHASGRLTMNWGGISFELNRATKVDFLQEALIVSEPEAEQEQNRVWAMGQLSGKFTVIPDWEKML